VAYEITGPLDAQRLVKRGSRHRGGPLVGDELVMFHVPGHTCGDPASASSGNQRRAISASRASLTGGALGPKPATAAGMDARIVSWSIQVSRLSLPDPAPPTSGPVSPSHRHGERPQRHRLTSSTSDGLFLPRSPGPSRTPILGRQPYSFSRVTCGNVRLRAAKRITHKAHRRRPMHPGDIGML